jgi:hypothetical protein
MKWCKYGRRKGAASCVARGSPRLNTAFARDPDVATPQQARAKVDETVAAGADYIKTWVDSGLARAPSSLRNYLRPFSSRRASNKLTFGHAYELIDARMLVERG